jgi:cysteine dioxygenase
MDLPALLSSRFGVLLSPTLEELRAALNQISDLGTRIQPYITEPKEYPYGRKIIYQNDHVEIIVVNLPKRGKTFIHDHGESFGCGQVVEGELTNAVYEIIEKDQIHKTEEHHIPAGEFFITPRGMIHQMLNEQAERVVSLHVYSPPLKGLKVYDQPGFLTYNS